MPTPSLIMKKSVIIMIIIAILIIITLILISNPKEQTVGGERDKHGCLGAAGYSWNETEQECVREWLSEDSRFQVTNFQQCLDASYPVQESYPRQCSTPSNRTFTE